MVKDLKQGIDRRVFLGAGAAAMAGLAAPTLAQDTGSTVEIEAEITEVSRRNISSFRSLDWKPYFSSTRNGAVLVDTTSRALHFWSEDLSVYKLYPTSVPLTEQLTRRGRTKVVQKIVGPEWRPTPR